MGTNLYSRVFSTILLVATSLSATAAIEKHVVIDGVDQTLVLEPNTRVIIQDDPAIHYQGKIKDRSDSWVRVTYLDGQWDGLLSLQGQLYPVTELADSAQTARSGSKTQLQALGGMESLGTCGTELTPRSLGKLASPKSLTVNNALFQGATLNFPTECVETIDGVCLLAELTIFFDDQFNTAFGSSYRSRGAEILNIVDGIYQDQLGIVFNKLSTDFSNGDQFTSSVNPVDILINMLDKRDNHSIRPSDPNIHSLMHFVTGRDFLYDDGESEDEYVVGLALGSAYDPDTDPPQITESVLCSSQGEAVATSQVLYRSGSPSAALTSLVVAHEIGHNLGMEHDGQEGTVTSISCTETNKIMYYSLVENASEFSTCSKTAAGLNISALPAVEACFDFPIAVSLTADAGNATEIGASASTLLQYDLDVTTANGFNGIMTITGSITSGDGTLGAVTLAGNACTVTSDGKSYTCSINSPAANSSLDLSLTTGETHQYITNKVTVGTDLVDMNEADNTATSTVLVKGAGLRPTTLTLTHNKSINAAVLAWQDHATDETGYQVERRIGSGSWKVIASNLAADAEQYVDLDIQPDDAHSYRVAAILASSVTATSNVATANITSNRLRDHIGSDSSGGSLSWLSIAGFIISLTIRSRLKNKRKACTV